MYLEFLFELGYHPSANKYISMFYGVFTSYLTYLGIYGFFLISFGLAFFQMFPTANEYPDTFEQMLLKMFTMLLGEFELMKIPFHPSGWMRILEMVFLTAFLILMVLVLQNLLNALAIKDTQEMLSISEQEKLYSIMKLTHFWEWMWIAMPRQSFWFLGQVKYLFFGKSKVLDDFEDFKVCFPVLMESCRNHETYIGFEKDEDPWIHGKKYDKWRYLIRFFEMFGFLNFKFFTIDKEIAEAAKKIISSKYQCQEVEDTEDVVKVCELILDYLILSQPLTADSYRKF